MRAALTRLRRAAMRLGLALAAGLGLGGAAHALTLEEALVELLQTHPQVEADQNRVNSAGERVRGARSAFFPQVELSTDYGVENIDTQARRVDGLDPFRRGRESATLSVTQNVYDGLHRNFETQGAQFEEEVAQKNLETSRQNVLFGGIGAYIGVLRQTQLFELIRINEEAVQRQFELESERVRVGAGLAVDLLLARSRLQLAKERRTVFRGNLQNSLSRYRQVFGQSPEVAALTVPVPPVDLLPTALDDAIAESLARNPVVASTSRQVDAARVRQKAARSDFFPRFDIVGAANFEDDVNAVSGIRRDWSVLLQARWSLFNGFATRANAAGAAFDHAASLGDLRLVKRRVEEEVRFAWQGLETSCERRFILENAVDIALNVLDSRRRLRDAGQETALRVLDAETEVFSSQINLASATFDETLSVYRMMLALGRVDAIMPASAGSAGPRAENPPSLIEWCRSNANLDLQEDDAFRSPMPLPGSGNPFSTPSSDDEGSGDPFAGVFGDEEEADDAVKSGDRVASLSVAEPDFQFEDDDVLYEPPSAAAAEPPNTGEQSSVLPGAFLLFDDTLSTGAEQGASGTGDGLPRFEFESDDGLSRTSAAGN